MQNGRGVKICTRGKRVNMALIVQHSLPFVTTGFRNDGTDLSGVSSAQILFWLTTCWSGEQQRPNSQGTCKAAAEHAATKAGHLVGESDDPKFADLQPRDGTGM